MGVFLKPMKTNLFQSDSLKKPEHQYDVGPVLCFPFSQTAGDILISMNNFLFMLTSGMISEVSSGTCEGKSLLSIQLLRINFSKAHK